MNLKTECLGVTPMPFDDVEYFAKFAHTWHRGDVRQWAKKIALSHERLRAELQGAEILLMDAAIAAGKDAGTVTEKERR